MGVFKAFDGFGFASKVPLFFCFAIGSAATFKDYYIFLSGMSEIANFTELITISEHLENL